MFSSRNHPCATPCHFLASRSNGHVAGFCHDYIQTVSERSGGANDWLEKVNITSCTLMLHTETPPPTFQHKIKMHLFYTTQHNLLQFSDFVLVPDLYLLLQANIGLLNAR